MSRTADSLRKSDITSMAKKARTTFRRSQKLVSHRLQRFPPPAFLKHSAEFRTAMRHRSRCETEPKQDMYELSEQDKSFSAVEHLVFSVAVIRGRTVFPEC